VEEEAHEGAEVEALKNKAARRSAWGGWSGSAEKWGSYLSRLMEVVAPCCS
jgi:hypothetical protein